MPREGGERKRPRKGEKKTKENSVIPLTIDHAARISRKPVGKKGGEPGHGEKKKKGKFQRQEMVKDRQKKGMIYGASNKHHENHTAISLTLLYSLLSSYTNPPRRVVNFQGWGRRGGGKTLRKGKKER